MLPKLKVMSRLGLMQSGLKSQSICSNCSESRRFNLRTGKIIQNQNVYERFIRCYLNSQVFKNLSTNIAKIILAKKNPLHRGVLNKANKND